MIKKRIKNAVSLLAEANECLKKGEFGKILGFLKILDQNNFLVFVTAGETFRRMGRIEDAVASFYKAQELFELNFIQKEGLVLERMSLDEITNLPVDPKINLGLALCRKNQGDLGKAISLLKGAAKELYAELKKSHDFVFAGVESPESPEGIFRRAEIFEAAGLFADAFNLLCSLVSVKMSENILVEGATAGR